MIRILGIDPGSQSTGYGIIESEGSRLSHIASGTIRCKPGHLSQRLKEIFSGISDLMQTYHPHHAAIEKVFIKKNVASALKLGHARGVAISAVTHALNEDSFDFFEYSPTQIKKSIVGYGRAEKAQMQAMVSTLLNLHSVPAQDEADALACAICHANYFATSSTINMIDNKV